MLVALTCIYMAFVYAVFYMYVDNHITHQTLPSFLC